MTPKEKAKELIRKIKDNLFEQRAVNITDEDAIVCVLPVIDEMLNEYSNQCPIHKYQPERHLYWKEVKQEIINF